MSTAAHRVHDEVRRQFLRRATRTVHHPHPGDAIPVRRRGHSATSWPSRIVTFPIACRRRRTWHFSRGRLGIYIAISL